VNVAHLLSERSEERPQVAAILGPTSGSPPLSFADLEARSARAASLLERHGLRAGDEVLVFVPLSAELYIALTALFRLGLIAMFVDPSAGRERLEQCCSIRPPRALIATVRAHLLRLVSPSLRRIPLKFAVGGGVPGAVPWSRATTMMPSDTIAACGEATPALLTFTSGSTGMPKAAVRSHGFMAAQQRVLAASLDLRPGQIDLTTQPIFTLANLAAGVTSLLPNADLRRPDRIDGGAVVAQIERYRPDRCSASPTFLERLVERAEVSGSRLDSFDTVLVGGGPVPPRLLERTRAVAPQAEVVTVYGSTEAEPIAHVAWREVAAADLATTYGGGGLLAGRPIEQIELRIVGDGWGDPFEPMTAEAFQQRWLPPGGRGEIVVRGDHVLDGYLHGRGDRENKFEVDGARWHRTGDAGYLDDRGRLWLLGRCAARIDDAHGSLYPFAVEFAAQNDPAVRRAALVLHEGQRTLVVEQRRGRPLDAEALQAGLAWAKLDRLLLVPRLPVDRRHNAKIDYPALRRLLERRSGSG
jgi:acyl-CoA synthetase (AMP-forming)/AMP-acid ligase II